MVPAALFSPFSSTAMRADCRAAALLLHLIAGLQA